MVYERINWANSPSKVSPFSADNFNRIEDGIEESTDAIRGRLADAALSATFVANDPGYDIGRPAGGERDDHRNRAPGIVLCGCHLRPEITTHHDGQSDQSTHRYSSGVVPLVIGNSLVRIASDPIG